MASSAYFSIEKSDPGEKNGFLSNLFFCRYDIFLECLVSTLFYFNFKQVVVESVVALKMS